MRQTLLAWVMGVCLLGWTGAADASPQSQAIELGLPSAIAARVQAYHDHVAQVRKTPTDTAVCGMLEEAQQLTKVLYDALDPKLSAAGTQRAKLAARVEALIAQLPGLSAVGAEGIEVEFMLFVNYHQLAHVSRGNAAASNLLEDASGVLGDQGWPGFIQQQTDEAGCLDPSEIEEPLAALVTAWPAGPTCLKRRLQKPLRDAFEDLASHTGFCKSRTEATRDVAAIATLLRRLPDLNGPASAEKLEQGVRSKESRFHFVGG
jgi:hypothetical protein